MGTLGKLKSRIARELDRDDISVEISDAIATAIAHYRAIPFYFNEGRAEMATAAGQLQYQLPEDYIAIQWLMATSNNRDYVLEQDTMRHLEAIRDGSETGSPSKYAIYSQQLEIFPSPDNEYSLMMTYTKELTLSASDSAINGWTEDAEELIRLHAKADLLMNRIRGPEAVAESASLSQAENNVLARLMRESALRTTSEGTLRGYPF